MSPKVCVGSAITYFAGSLKISGPQLPLSKRKGWAQMISNFLFGCKILEECHFILRLKPTQYDQVWETEPLKIIWIQGRELKCGTPASEQLYLGCSKCTQDYNTMLDYIHFILTHTCTHALTYIACIAFNQQFQIQVQNQAPNMIEQSGQVATRDKESEPSKGGKQSSVPIHCCQKRTGGLMLDLKRFSQLKNLACV